MLVGRVRPPRGDCGLLGPASTGADGVQFVLRRRCHRGTVIGRRELAGTLIVPDGEGPFPAVVLVSGAGPQDRDATNAGHKPFAVLAEHLASQGVAVLRTDDRGVGGSTGALGGTTWLDLAADVRAGVGFLRTRAKINPNAIGIVGHSQGGLIAPIVVAEDPQVAFLVSLAGPSTDFIELTLSQRRRAAVAQGVSEEVIARTESVLAEAFAAIARADTLPAARASVQRILTAEALARLGAPETARDAVAGQLASAELFVALQHTPQRVLPRVRVPVLALTGALDSIVDADANLAAIAAALVGNPRCHDGQARRAEPLFSNGRDRRSQRIRRSRRGLRSGRFGRHLPVDR